MGHFTRFKIILLIGGLLIGTSKIKAQQKDTSSLGKVLNTIPKSVDKKPNYADSLLTRFCNRIDSTYHDYHFWTKGITHQFVVLQIRIDEHGQVRRIWYSDSADKIFKDAFLKQSVSSENISILEKYARAKNYKDISILIPVYFESSFERKPSFEHNYNFMESILKFDGKPFSGESVILEPVIVRVLAEHNM